MPKAIDETRRRRVHRAWLAFAGWTSVAVINALILQARENLPLRYGLESSLAWYYSLGTAVWIACALDLRFELWKQTLARALLIRAAIGVAALTAWAAFMLSFSRATVGPNYWTFVYSEWQFQLLTAVMVYAAAVGVGLTVQGFDRERRQQQREARLELLAREAELTAIKAQLQPHFLFNSLNSVLALIEHDPAEARRMLTRLSSLLHAVFDGLDEPLTPLERELDTIRDYLEIERIRFGERLTFSIEIDAAATRTLVPPFLLQPIVENAVKHGIEPHTRPGAVRIDVARRNGRLLLTVADTGPGGAGVGVSHGRGLTLTRRRLETLYGAGASIRSQRTADGYSVTIDVPVTPDVA